MKIKYFKEEWYNLSGPKSLKEVWGDLETENPDMIITVMEGGAYEMMVGDDEDAENMNKMYDATVNRLMEDYELENTIPVENIAVWDEMVELTKDLMGIPSYPSFIVYRDGELKTVVPGYILDKA